MKIAVCTGTRADWGLLSPLASVLKAKGADILVYATNMHLMPELGETWREIETDGFEISRRIPVSGNMAEVTAQTLAGFGKAFEEDRPDAALILGDRFEMLGAATAASLCGVPIIHIAGGTVSEGALDDSIRHAITKLSTLHLVETEACRRRVIRMGEAPERVICTGAIGVHNTMMLTPLSRESLEESLKFRFQENTLLVTLHPATLSGLTPEKQMEELIAALEEFQDYGIIFTYPNNDSDPKPLIDMITAFVARNPEKRMAIPSLGRLRYLSSLRHVKGVVGNSSSGIVEVPSAGIPTLDIGIRQKGREHGPGVIHCGDGREEIAEGIRRILSPEVQELARKRINPYHTPHTPEIMANAILSHHFRPFCPKPFYDSEK